MAKSEGMACRRGCGACCIAPSITSPLPGMEEGKPAGMRCRQLSADNQCLVFGKPERPGFCRSYQPSAEYCGKDREEALLLLARLEAATGNTGNREE